MNDEIGMERYGVNVTRSGQISLKFSDLDVAYEGRLISVTIDVTTALKLVSDLCLIAVAERDAQRKGTTTYRPERDP